MTKHRALWAQANGPIPPGHVIHHVNGDRSDNRLENLQCLTTAEHGYHHQALVLFGVPVTLAENTYCGPKLRRLRVASGIPQGDFAHAMRASQSFLCRVEKGHITLHPTHFRICRKLLHRMYDNRERKFWALLELVEERAHAFEQAKRRLSA